MTNRGAASAGLSVRTKKVARANAAINQYLALAGITIVALVFRYYRLGAWSFEYDELNHLRDVFNTPPVDLYKVRDGAAYVPGFGPVSVVLTRVILELTQFNETGARMGAAFVGALSIPVFYFPLRRLLGINVALLSVLMLAIAPRHIYMSQYARYYTSLILFATLALFFFYFALERRSWLFSMLAVMMLALAALERLHALFFVPITLAYLVLLVILGFEKPKGLDLKILALIGVLSLAIYFIYEQVQVLILNRPPVSQVLFSEQFLGFDAKPRPISILVDTVRDVGVPVVCLAVVGGYYQLRQKSRFGLLMIAAIVVPLLGLMVLAPFFRAERRYAVLSWQCWMVLSAVGLKELYQLARRDWRAPAGFLTVVGLFFLEDRAIRDGLYYAAPQIRVFAVAVAVAVITILFLPQASRIAGMLSTRPLAGLSRSWPVSPAGRHTGYLLFTLGVLPIVFGHVLMTSALYYQYQYGHRTNEWREAMAVVKEGVADGDIVLSAVVAPTSYYYGERVKWLGSYDLDELVRDGQRVWLIEEHAAYTMKGTELQEWIDSNCERVASFMRQYRRQIAWTGVVFCHRPGSQRSGER